MAKRKLQGIKSFITTNDTTAKREDLLDLISNVNPVPTPFTTSVGASGGKGMGGGGAGGFVNISAATMAMSGYAVANGTGTVSVYDSEYGSSVIKLKEEPKVEEELGSLLESLLPYGRDKE